MDKDAQLACEWEALARRDPFWASLTSGKRHVNWVLEDFLSSGQRELTWSTESACLKGIFPDRRTLAVDFGCGPGRFTGHLAERFEHVVGVDISPTMLRVARQIHPQDTIEFVTSTASIEDRGTDLIYSTFVLQHLSMEQLNGCLREFARILHPKGLIIFQYPARPRKTPGGLAFTLVPPLMINAIQRHVLRYPGVMPMNWMRPADVEQRAASAGLSVSAYGTGPTYSQNWDDIWYFARKPKME